MADVPAWMLLAQTVLSGGIGACATLIVPRADIQKRAEEQRNAAYAIMRQKAEESFLALSAARAIVNKSYHRNIALLMGTIEDDFSLDVTPFRALDAAVGLIATYFPDRMKIIAEGEVERTAKCDPLTLALAKIERKTPAHLEARINLTKTAADVTSQTLFKLQSFLVESIRPYHPTVLSELRKAAHHGQPVIGAPPTPHTPGRPASAPSI